jgi:hypothetical protein
MVVEPVVTVPLWIAVDLIFSLAVYLLLTNLFRSGK